MVYNLERTLDDIKQEGILEGRLEGKKEGKREGKIEVAKKLLKKGLSIEEVLEITELDIEKISVDKYKQ
ncbi:hypothetical protein [Clostridiisalibacter paucivorans]|uniref:hypothetical protein n=1 Tax=Clostridiisalibacter paucivorans TaxID=408753 RepID=UPI00047DDB8F|nr:hypothetical protein [Clostridiisalibacter paucivorans]